MQSLEKLELIGGGYTLQAQASIKTHSWLGGNSERGDENRSHTWWEGQIRMKTPQGKELVFEFQTAKQYDIQQKDMPNLHSALLRVSNVTEKAVVVNSDAIIAAFCKQIEKQVIDEEAKGKLFVVCVVPDAVDGLPFVNKGLIIEPGYQMELLPTV